MSVKQSIVQKPSSQAKILDQSQKNDIQLSVGFAKKIRTQTEKDLALLENRINLLKKEEEKTMQRIQDTNKKANQILLTKKRNEELQSQKISTKQQDDEHLKLRQQHQIEFRIQSNEQRKAIREALATFKKQETEEVKKISQQNQSTINLFKNGKLQEQKIKYENIRRMQLNSKRKVQNYWNNRIKYFQQEQNNRKAEHMLIKNQKEMEIQEMEKEESDILQRLQQSQNLHESMQKELSLIIQMKAKDYIKSFDEKQNFLNNSSCQNNSSLQLMDLSQNFEKHKQTQEQINLTQPNTITKKKFVEPLQKKSDFIEQKLDSK